MFKTIVRAVRLNLFPMTKSKNELLGKLGNSVLDASNFMLSIFKSSKPKSFNKLHQSSYDLVRGKFPVHCQILIETMHRVWENRGSAERFSRRVIDYNVPRSGKLAETKRGNPVVCIASFKGTKRVGLPIEQDGAWRRFKTLLTQGYSFSQFRLVRRGESWVLMVNIRREVAVGEPKPGQAIVGIDVGTACLASVSIVCQGRVLRQLYFGRDVVQRKRDICVRRSKLQSKADKGSAKAKQTLRKLRGRERNFDKTRCYQVAHQVVALARRYGAIIAIEDLNGLKDAKLSRKSNRKVKRMPYTMFRRALESVGLQSGIQVAAINAKNTSKICSRCGRKGIRRSNNWAWFRCLHCGLEMNADRNASVNIGLRLAKLLSERQNQTSESGRAVTHAVCPDEGSFERLRRIHSIPMESPDISPGMVTG